MPTYSWFGGAYQSASLVADVPPDYAATFAAVSGGNPSAKGTAVLEDPFPRLESCVKPNGTTTCSYDYLLVALQALYQKLAASCPARGTYIFVKLSSAGEQAQFARFISRYPPRFINGTKATLKITETCQPVGSGASWDAIYGCYAGYAGSNLPGTTVADYFKSHPGLKALAVPGIAAAKSLNGNTTLLTFFNPSTTDPYGICTSDTLPGTRCGIWNQSLLLHESLHEYYGYFDGALRKSFGRKVSEDCTDNITDYIADKVYGKLFVSCPP
jgi:hypothetical protein